MEETYLTEGEFAFVSYMPTKLKVGMAFLSRLDIGVTQTLWNYFTLEEVPEDEQMFMSVHGAPVHMFITDEEGGSISDKSGIGWFHSDDTEELHPITDYEINRILNEYDGFMDVECDFDGNVLYYEDKIIISYLSEVDGEEEEDEYS